MSYTNNNLFNLTLAKLRKDKKGGITMEEFESLLSARSLWLFSKRLVEEGSNKGVQESLSPFKVIEEMVAMSGVYATKPTGLASLSRLEYGDEYSEMIPVDLVSDDELSERKINSITTPSADYPVAIEDDTKMKFYGITDETVYFTYYKQPTDPYLDYYVDTSGNYQYLSEGGNHALTTGEISRSGLTTGTVTSFTAEMEWDDQDKIQLVEYVLTDLGVGLGDQAVMQSSVMERENIKQP